METSWLQDNANQLVHYRDKIGVCNVICFCQCPKHESISILLVRPREKQSKKYKHPMFVLPGGKRDFRAFRQTEPCWDTVVREFQEEVDEDLNSFCRKKCRFFEETIQVSLDVDMVTDADLREIVQTNNCKFISNPNIMKIDNRSLTSTHSDIVASQVDAHSSLAEEELIDTVGIQGSFPAPFGTNQLTDDVSQDKEQDEFQTQITRRIRSYFVEVECDQLPDKHFGRFNLYEMSERKWFSLESLVEQFKVQHATNKYEMTVSPKMFRCISRFGGKLVNIQQKQLQKLKFVYSNKQQSISLDDDSVVIETDQDIQDPAQEFLDHLIQRVNKTHILFAKINSSIKKQPVVLKLGSDILLI